MSLPRFVARSMLASLFVGKGAKALRSPGELVPVAQPVTDRLVPLVKKYAPTQVSAYVPTDTTTLVRLGGLGQILGGLALAKGALRRPAALLLSLSMLPQLLATLPFGRNRATDDDGAQRREFANNIALLGGVLLAAQDTEGKPSLAWRASAGSDRVAARTRKAGRKLAKQAARAKKDAQRAAKRVEKKFD